MSTYKNELKYRRQIWNESTKTTIKENLRQSVIFQPCGFYNDVGGFAFNVGLPAKSGVGGGIVAVYPGKYCISTWSPGLNQKGNSLLGIKALEMFTTETKLSIF